MYFSSFIYCSTHRTTSQDQNPSQELKRLSPRSPRRKRHPIRHAPIPNRGILPITRKLIPGLGQTPLLQAQERAQFTPAVRAWATGRETRAQGHGALVDDEMDISCHGAGHVAVRRRRSSGTVGGDGVRSRDDFNVDAGAKGLEVGDNELLIGWRAGGR